MSFLYHIRKLNDDDEFIHCVRNHFVSVVTMLNLGTTMAAS